MLKFGKGGLNAQLNCNKNTYSKSIYCGFLSCTMGHLEKFKVTLEIPGMQFFKVPVRCAFVAIYKIPSGMAAMGGMAGA